MALIWNPVAIRKGVLRYVVRTENKDTRTETKDR
jgi:hypothetical protein